MQPKVDRQVMSVIRQRFDVGDFVYNDYLTDAMLRRVYLYLFDGVHALENLIFEIKEGIMDAISI